MKKNDLPGAEGTLRSLPLGDARNAGSCKCWNADGPPEQGKSGARTILVVDDDRGVRNSVGEMLRRFGYCVVTAEDGESALGLLRERRAVDLVISDRRMPGMDGLALARRIKEMIPGLPVVIMTGYGDLESYLCASHLGVSRYIGKPFGPRELHQTVKDAVVAPRNGP